jgi:hypothetical protein
MADSAGHVPLLLKQRFWTRSRDAPSKVGKKSIRCFGSVRWTTLIQHIMDASANKDWDVVGVNMWEIHVF